MLHGTCNKVHAKLLLELRGRSKAWSGAGKYRTQARNTWYSKCPGHGEIQAWFWKVAFWWFGSSLWMKALSTAKETGTGCWAPGGANGKCREVHAAGATSDGSWIPIELIFVCSATWIPAADLGIQQVSELVYTTETSQKTSFFDDWKTWVSNVSSNMSQDFTQTITFYAYFVGRSWPPSRARWICFCRWLWRPGAVSWCVMLQWSSLVLSYFCWVRILACEIVLNGWFHARNSHKIHG